MASVTTLVVALGGNVDAGKSSLIGVLTSNQADDGRGSARAHVLRHEAERQHGRTSDPSLTYVGYDDAGGFVPISWKPQHTPRRRDDSAARQRPAARVPGTSGVADTDTINVPTVSAPPSSSSLPSSSLVAVAVAVAAAAASESATCSVTSAEPSLRTARTVCFLDLCGHIRFLPTTLTRFIATRPRFMMLMVDASSGTVRVGVDEEAGVKLNPMTIHHMQLAWALDCPIVILLTKMDIAPKAAREATLRALKAHLKTLPRSVPKRTWTVQNVQDVDRLLDNSTHMLQQYVPIFPVSSVNLVGMDVLRYFLQCYPLTNNTNRIEVMPLLSVPTSVVSVASAASAAPSASDASVAVGKTTGPDALFYMEKRYNVTGVGGLLISGFVLQGTLRPMTEMWLGPFAERQPRVWRKVATIWSKNLLQDKLAVTYRFIPVRLRTIEINCERVDSADSSQCVAVAVSAIRATDRALMTRSIRVGRVLIPIRTRFSATTYGVCMRFQADVLITHHAITISLGFQAVALSHTVRQTVILISIDKLRREDGSRWDKEEDQPPPMTPSTSAAAAASSSSSSVPSTSTSSVAAITTTTSLPASSSEQPNVSMSTPPPLRSGYRARITLQFLAWPEFLVCGSHLLLREGELRAVGRIHKLELLTTSATTAAEDA